MLNVLLCDDNPQFLIKLGEIAERILDNMGCSVSKIGDPSELSDNLDFDIAVLDIELPHFSGIEAAKRLLQANPDCQIIFMSAFQRYVTDVYDVPHMCMILKDRADEFLPQYLLKAIENQRKISASFLTVSANKTSFRLLQADICYIERRGHNSYIVSRRKENIVVSEKLDSLLAKLNKNYFCRCHVSYIVNFNNVVSYQRKQFTMCNGAMVPISRINYEATQEKYISFLGREL